MVLLRYCSQAITQSDISACGWPVGYALTRQDSDPDSATQAVRHLGAKRGANGIR